MNRQEELLNNFGNAIEEIKALREGVEELVILLEHVWQNRERLAEVLSGLRKPEAMAETISCERSCDSSCDSLAEAVAGGWSDLREDKGGLSWNYLGCCPSCAAEDLEEAKALAETTKPKPTGLLFE